MIFSGGELMRFGAGLTATKLMDTLTKAMMDGLGLASMSYFSLYALLTGIFIASHFNFPKQEHEDDYFHADSYWYCAGIKDRYSFVSDSCGTLH